MKQSKLWLSNLVAVAVALSSHAVQAQSVTFPAAGQQVRGTIKVTLGDVPDGGYTMLYLDGTGLPNLRVSTSEPFYMLNTFALPEGQHTLNAVFINAGGKRVGTNSVTFSVANTSVDTSAEGVRLKVWTISDRTADAVRRYRVFAESNASIEGGKDGDNKNAGGDANGAGGGVGGGAGKGRAGGGNSGGGDTSGKDKYAPAPLDWQQNILIRSVVRDVGLLDSSANIRSVVQESFMRQRLSEETKDSKGGGGETKVRRHKKADADQPDAPTIPTGPPKSPWGTWKPSPDMGRYFVKTIKQNGDEINATRKAATLPIADLLPRFPESVVHPGSTWETEMSIVGQIPATAGITLRAPMTFVSFESIQTPNGIERRCAKLESRFNLPQEVAERIGHGLQSQIGSKGGSTGAAGGGGTRTGAGDAEGAAGAGSDPTDFKSISTMVTREVWFDIKANLVLRSTDNVETSYEEEQDEPEDTAGDTGAGAAGFGGTAGLIGGGTAGRPGANGAALGDDDNGAAGGAGASQRQAATPTRVTYNLRITKYLDDTVPAPSSSYTAGAGTAHARDNVTDPTLAKVIAAR